MTVTETFYNKNHDAKTGRFTSGPGGASSAVFDRLSAGKTMTDADEEAMAADFEALMAPIAKKHGLTMEIKTHHDNSRVGIGVDFSDPNAEISTDSRLGRRRIGAVHRTIQTGPNGTIIVNNEGFRLRSKYQNKGIATEVGKALEDWYRANGVNEIRVHANVDVGGYAWAKAGFQYINPETGIRHLHERLGSRIGRPEGKAWEDYLALTEKVKAGEEILPYEIAMAGHEEGLSTWPGKEAMIHSDWHGIKYLQPPAVTASINQFYSPSQPRDRRGRWTRRGFGDADTLPGMEDLKPYRAEEWIGAWAEGGVGGKTDREIEEQHDRLIDNFNNSYQDLRGKPLPAGLGKATLQDDPAADGFGWANYTDEWAEPVNASLRGIDGQWEVESYSDWDAQFITDYMDRDIERWSVPFSEESFVFRGIKPSPDITPDAWRPGTVIEDPGFLSTSGDRSIANKFRSTDGWAMVYRIPEGTRYLPGVDHESEAILPRNSLSRVVQVDPEKRIVYLDYEGNSLTASIEEFYAPGQPRDRRGRWAKTFGVSSDDLRADPTVLAKIPRIEGGQDPPEQAAYMANAISRSENLSTEFGTSQLKTNCQASVVAFEMRMRGLDAVARPTPLLPRFIGQAMLGQTQEGHLGANQTSDYLSPSQAISQIHPAGSRGAISYVLMPGVEHIVSWTHDGDAVRFYDPQSGEPMDVDARVLLGVAPNHSYTTHRLDEATIGPQALKYVTDSATVAKAEQASAESFRLLEADAPPGGEAEFNQRMDELDATIREVGFKP